MLVDKVPILSYPTPAQPRPAPSLVSSASARPRPLEARRASPDGPYVTHRPPARRRRGAARNTLLVPSAFHRHVYKPIQALLVRGTTTSASPGSLDRSSRVPHVIELCTFRRSRSQCSHPPAHALLDRAPREHSPPRDARDGMCARAGSN